MERRINFFQGVSIDQPRSQSENANRGKFSELVKIIEEDEWSSIHSKSIVSKPAPKHQLKKKNYTVFTEPAQLSEDPHIAEYQTFLSKLFKNFKIYEYFIKSATSPNLLKPSICRPNSYYYKHIQFSAKRKLRQQSKSVAGKRCVTEIYYNDTNISSSTSEEISNDEYQIYENHGPPRILEFLQSLKIQDAKKEKTPQATSRTRRKKKINQKRIILDRSKQKIISIFQEMCNTQSISLKACRLTNYLFKQFLVKKFPQEMAEVISKYFDFKSANYEEFCSEMDKMITSPEEKLMSLCFDAFDFNRDKYICYQDAYAAIETRKDDIYDSDLVKLQAMFDMKKHGLIPSKNYISRKGRRLSVMSISSEISAFEENAKKRDVLAIHPDKPEALTFDDFCKIEFKGRPQLLYNLFLYTCNYDIIKCHEVTTPIIKSRKQSEDIIIELSQNPNLSDNYQNDPKLTYYKNLEQAMSLFTFAQAKDLGDKFEILRDKSENDKKVISKNSMVANWPKVFGPVNDYVSERYFYYFTKNKNSEITKPMFLNTIHEVLTDELIGRYFAFDIYDARGDGKITSDEVYRMEQNLPENSLIYKECSV